MAAKTTVWAALVATLVTACAQAPTSSLPDRLGPRVHSSVNFRIAIARTNPAARQPAYISASTTRLTIVLNTVNGSVPSGGPVTTTIGLTPTSTGCALANGYTQCAVNVSAPIGTDNFTFNLTDGTNVLSTNTVATSVVANAANLVSLTLNGIATALSIASSGSHVTGSQGAGFSLIGASPQAFSVIPLDHDGNQIIGPGAPTATLTSATPAKIAVTTNGTNAFNVAAKAYSTSAITLTATIGSVTGSASVSTLQELFVADCQDAYTVRGFKIVAGTAPTEIVGDRIPNISNGGTINCAAALTVDTSGTLWVADIGTTLGNGQVLGFVPGSTSPATTISGLTDPAGLAFDASGNLWISDLATLSSEQIQKFAAGTYANVPAATFAVPQSYLSGTTQDPLAFDTSGNLWVGRQNDAISIRAYAPGSTTPISGDDIASNHDHLEVEQIAFDANGYLWHTDGTDSVLNRDTPGVSAHKSYQIANTINYPTGLAIAADNSLWMGNYAKSNVVHLTNSDPPTLISTDTLSPSPAFVDVCNIALAP